MKYYRFAGSGLALGSVFVVIADSEDMAWYLAADQAVKIGVDHNSLELVETKPLFNNAVIY